MALWDMHPAVMETHDYLPHGRLSHGTTPTARTNLPMGSPALIYAFRVEHMDLRGPWDAMAHWAQTNGEKGRAAKLVFSPLSPPLVH